MSQTAKNLDLNCEKLAANTYHYGLLNTSRPCYHQNIQRWLYLVLKDIFNFSRQIFQIYEKIVFTTLYRRRKIKNCTKRHVTHNQRHCPKKHTIIINLGTQVWIYILKRFLSILSFLTKVEKFKTLPKMTYKQKIALPAITFQQNPNNHNVWYRYVNWDYPGEGKFWFYNTLRA